MDIYIVITSSLIILASFGFSIYQINKNTKLNNRLSELYSENLGLKKIEDFLSKQNEDYKREIENISNLHLVLTKENEAYKIKLEESEAKLSEWQKLKQESLDHAKAAIFDAGKKLSEQLLDLHKKENQESSEQTKKSFIEATTKLNEDIMNITKVVSILSNQVKSSVDDVNIIKRTLLSPDIIGQMSETTLENIIKSMGLIANIDYFMQYNINFDDIKLRPDAVIFLPCGNVIVIDSKASKFFLEYEMTSQEEYKEKLIVSMNAHLKSLVTKDYKDAVRKNLRKIGRNKEINHVSMLMFVASESMLEKLHKFDPEFFHRAWESDVFPVGPSGLVNILSHSRFVINEAKKAEYADKIIDEVSKLVSALNVMLGHARKIGSSLKSANHHYDKFAASFNGNLLPKVNKINSLGVAKTKEDISVLERYQLISFNENVPEIEAEAQEIGEDAI